MACTTTPVHLNIPGVGAGRPHSAPIGGPPLGRLTVAALPRPFLALARRDAKRCAEAPCAAAPQPKRRLSGKGPAERPPVLPVELFCDDGHSKSSQWFRERLALMPSTPATTSWPMQQYSERKTGGLRLLKIPCAEASPRTAQLRGEGFPGGFSQSCRWAVDRRALAGHVERASPRTHWQPSRDRHCSLEAAAGACNRRFDLFIKLFYTDHLAHDDNDREACEHGERLSEEHYEDLCRSFAALLPWTGHAEIENSCADGLREYAALEFQGSAVRCHDNIDADNALNNAEMLATARAYSTQNMARDALCSVAATLASRREKSWLEAFDIDFELAERQKEIPKESKQDRVDAVVADIATREVRGYFAHGLVSPRSSFRFAVAKPAAPGFPPRPASLLLTYRLPLIEALEQMDDGGPLPEGWSAAVSPHQCAQPVCTRNMSSVCASCCSAEGEASSLAAVPSLVAAGSPAWEFALQELDPHGRGGRQPLHLVCPEPSLSALLVPELAGKDVVLLDAVAALAPRAKAKEHGLSDIVQSELADMLSRAKSRGEAVVFMLGGDQPQVLAEKVYLRPPFTDHGLRCGYLRWRRAGAKAWAKEKPQEQRICIGLQLP